MKYTSYWWSMIRLKALFRRLFSTLWIMLLGRRAILMTLDE